MVPLLFPLQAIYELYRGEQDLIEDLQLARKVRTFSLKIIQINQNIYVPFVLTLLLFSHFRHTMIRC